MKIIHITPSYKPAYTYGGTIQSVGKLCEALERSEYQEELKGESVKAKASSGEQRAESGGRIVGELGTGSSEYQESSIKYQVAGSKGQSAEGGEHGAEELGRRRVGELEYQVSGSEYQVASSKYQDAKSKYQVEVLTTTANGKTELDVPIGKPVLVEGVSVTYFKRWTKDHSHFSPGLLLRLRKEIIESGKRKAEGEKLKNVDEAPLIIHIHAWWNLVSVLSCLVAKWYKIPVILSPRGMLTSYSQHNRHSFAKSIIHRFIGKRLLKYCHIHATSELEKHDILKVIQPKSITVIPNLVNLEYQVAESRGRGAEGESLELGVGSWEEQSADREYQESSIKYQEELKDESIKAKANSGEQGAGSREEVASSKYQVLRKEYQVAGIKYQDRETPFRLIFLSRVEEKKGLELLFDALHLLDIVWTLTIAGSGEGAYVESLKRKAESLKLNDRINWIGQVGNNEKYKLMAQHDLLVLTSYNENFANVVVESLSVGTAVLISEQVGLSDYIIKRDLGWVTDLSPENIKSNLKEAFNNLTQRELINTTAPAIIREDFNDEVLVERYMEMYTLRS